MTANLGKLALIAFLLILSTPFFAFTQQRIQGSIFNKSGKEPVAYASVITIRGIGSMTNSEGRFNFWFPRNIRTKDSVSVSAVGYLPVKISLDDLVSKKEIYLEESAEVLENVLVVSTLKGNPQNFAYYRGWSVKGNNGEIGQVIELPKKNLTLGVVQVKINQNYDTCWLKLHIRAIGGLPKIGGWLPEEEMLKEEIIVPATVKYGLMEFDLTEKNVKLHGKAVYVGFEVLSCSSPQSDTPSFSFMGSEEGENLFRNSPGGAWESGSKYTIYIRLLLR